MLFIGNSILLGVGLAMDAFSVSVVNGLKDPKMSLKRTLIIAGTYGFFQALMPMIGWLLVHTILETFQKVAPFIPWIGAGLLFFLGGKMIYEGVKERLEKVSLEYHLSVLRKSGSLEDVDGEELEDSLEEEKELFGEEMPKEEKPTEKSAVEIAEDGTEKLSVGTLMLQGVATSIDALSVGFAIASYNAFQAGTAAVIIAVVTFIICILGLKIGKKIGEKVTSAATILGGVILILIGLEIVLL